MSMVLAPGERANLLLTADQPGGSFWVPVATLAGHNSPALLTYDDAHAAAALPPPPLLRLGCA